MKSRQNIVLVGNFQKHTRILGEISPDNDVKRTLEKKIRRN